MVKPCRSKKPIIYDVSCQGCANHEGPHWSYDGEGFLVQWKNRNDKDPHWKNIALSYTPPDHKSWIHPKDMYEKSYRHMRVEEEYQKEMERRKRAKKRRKV